MRRARGLAATAAAIMLLAGCGSATASQAGAGGSTAPAGTSATPGPPPAAVLSAARPCELPGTMGGPAPGQGLNGPAVTDLAGGAVAGGFSLDGGRFAITPPPAGDVPRAPRAVAECEALAALASDGEPFIAADGVSQMAVGYGLVTASAGLPVSSWRGSYAGMTLPTPAPARYQGRLAWVAVFRITDRAGCPGVTQTSAPNPGGSYAGFYYEVFIVDAATGGDAITYDEAAPAHCNGPGLSAPGVSIPVELTSVRWELGRPGPHGSRATLIAYVPPCLDHEKQAGVGYGSHLLTVLAYGQVAASCGPPRPVIVRLEPALGPGSVNHSPGHAPTGLYLTGSGDQFLP